MQKRHLAIIVVSIAATFLITSMTLSHGVNFIEDGLDDVMKYEDGILVGKDDYANKVDIVSLTFIGVDLTLNLQDTPTPFDGNHIYEIIIVWDSTGSYQNKTEITIGAVGGDPTLDLVSHSLVNSTGDALANQPAPVYNQTTISPYKMQWNLINEMYAFSNLATPEYVNATATYTTTEGTFDVVYQDTYLEGEAPPPSQTGIIWDFSTILGVLGTILVCGFAGYTVGQISVYFLTTNIRTRQANTICMAVFVVGLAVLVNFWFWLTPYQLIWNIAAFLATIVFGFMWATRGIMRLKFDSPLPDNLPIDSDEKLGAVIVLSKGESEEYNPLPLIRKYYDNKEYGVEQKAKFLQPLEFFKVKSKYTRLYKKVIGNNTETMKLAEAKNPYRSISKNIVSKLEESFLDFDIYYDAFVNDWPTLNQVLLTVIARGASRVTFLKLFTSDCYDYSLAVEEMKRIDYSKVGADIRETEFLGSNEEIQKFVASKINAKIPKKDKNEIGLILVSEGQPIEYDQVFSLTETEDTFRNGIVKKISKQKVAKENIKLAWIENRSPSIQESFIELIDKGCKTIVVAAASTPIDGLNTLIDIPEEVEELTKETEIEILTVNGWNDDDELMKIYLKLIASAKTMPLVELGADAEIVLQSTKPDDDELINEENDEPSKEVESSEEENSSADESIE